MQETFIDLIHREKERGKTILLSSHIFSEIDSTCDRIAIIRDGKIVSEFVANDLKHASRKYYNITFGSEAAKDTFLLLGKAIPSLSVTKSEGADAELSVEDADLNTLIALLADADVRSFSNKRETLEDYFMKFYREDKDFGGALS